MLLVPDNGDRRVTMRPYNLDGEQSCMNGGSVAGLGFLPGSDNWLFMASTVRHACCFDNVQAYPHVCCYVIFPLRKHNS